VPVTHTNPVDGHHTLQENEPCLLLDFAVAVFLCWSRSQQGSINGQESGERHSLSVLVGKKASPWHRHGAAMPVSLLWVKLLGHPLQVSWGERPLYLRFH